MLEEAFVNAVKEDYYTMLLLISSMPVVEGRVDWKIWEFRLTCVHMSSLRSEITASVASFPVALRKPSGTCCGMIIIAAWWTLRIQEIAKNPEKQ